MKDKIKAWLGLGSNRQQPIQQIKTAISHLAACDEVEVLQTSSLYKTPPWGDRDQDEFINAVLQVETTLQPLELLKLTAGIEAKMGRKRCARRWGPRLIDIDILLFANLVLQTDELVIPHPRMHERGFVLLPVSELEPELNIPGKGTVTENLENVDCNGIQRLKGELRHG